MAYTELTKCLACNGNNLVEYLNLGEQPLANAYQLTADILPIYPLKVNFCQDCTHSQLSIAVDPAEMFSDYKYVSGTTATLKEHFKGLVNYALGYRTVPYPRILDIGCNDGTLLETFKEKCDSSLKPYRLYGVDPAENLAEISTKKDFKPYVNYWSSKFAETFVELEKENGKVNIITACNVFAHNLNPYDFLIGCKKALNKTGIVIIEMPYCLSTIKLNDLGQIYHEHINYFNVTSMMALCDKAGFKIKDIHEFPNIHGGTIRFTLRKVGRESEKIVGYYKQEQAAGLHKLETYHEYQERINQNIYQLKNELYDFHLKGYEIVAYGASAKSSTLFNLPDFYSRLISYVVDDNPLKIHHFCPGSGIAIEPPEELKNPLNTNKKAILMTTHNFKKEIIERLKRLGFSGPIINYVPKVSVEWI